MPFLGSEEGLSGRWRSIPVRDPPAASEASNKCTSGPTPSLGSQEGKNPDIW